MVVTRSMTTTIIDEIVVNHLGLCLSDSLCDTLLKNELPSKH